VTQGTEILWGGADLVREEQVVWGGLPVESFSAFRTEQARGPLAARFGSEGMDDATGLPLVVAQENTSRCIPAQQKQPWLVGMFIDIVLAEFLWRNPQSPCHPMYLFSGYFRLPSGAADTTSQAGDFAPLLEAPQVWPVLQLLSITGYQSDPHSFPGRTVGIKPYFGPLE